MVPVNVKLLLWLIKHHAKNTYGRVAVWLHGFLSSTLKEVSEQLHVLAALPLVKSAVPHWIGGWLHSTADLKFWRREKSCPCQESNSGCSACSIITTVPWGKGRRLQERLVYELALLLRDHLYSVPTREWFEENRWLVWWDFGITPTSFVD